MKAFRQYMLVLTTTTLCVSVYIPIHYDISFPKSIAPDLDDRVRRTYSAQIDETRPDILMLGDSMLVPAVNGDTVSAALDQKVKMIGLSGTASTVWYLMIKNDILKAEHPPETVMIFFRDTMMTVPGYRTAGRYFDLIDEFASPDDSVLIQRAYINQMNPLEKLAESLFPLYGSRWRFRERIDSRIRYSLPNLLLDCDSSCMDKAMEIFGKFNMDETFLSNALAAADDYLYQGNHMDFDAQVEESFLPEIIRLCKEKDVRLVLVRLHIERFAVPGSEPPALRGYFDGMHQYLTANNVLFLDYGWDPRFTAAYYEDTVHLNADGQTLFTGIFVQDLLR